MEPNPFIELPFVVKEKIFSALDSSDRCIVRRVCFNFAIFINRHYGVELYIDNDNSNYLLTEPNYDEQVKAVKFVSLTKPIPDQISFANILQKLELTRIVASYNLVKILNNFSALENLIFSKVVMDKTDEIELWEPFAPQAKLKSISIELDFKRSTLSVNEQPILRLLSYFNLGALESFSIQRDESEILQNEFCIQGRRYWRDYYAQIEVIVEDEDDEAVLVNSIVGNIIFKAGNLKTLFLDNMHSFVAPGNPGVAEMNLEEFTATILSPSEWPAIVTIQTSLTILHLKFVLEVWPEVQTCIHNCGQTIRDLKLILLDTQITLPNNSLDINFLNTIPHLRQLHLEAPLLQKVCETFPTTLESLCIDGPMAREDLIDILNVSTELKTICLKSYGIFVQHIHEVDHGNGAIMDLQTFNHLIALPKMRKIVLLHCNINRDEVLNFCNATVGIHVIFEDAKLFVRPSEQLENQTIVNLEINLSRNRN